MNKLKLNFVSLEEANLITHSGCFHADEVFATIILAKYLGYSNEVKICRTNMVSGDYPFATIYDIGGGKYDHHQKGGNGCHDSGIPYAACGLVWEKCGRIIIIQKLCDLECYIPECVTQICLSIESSLIEPIDAVDNGYKVSRESPVYSVSNIIADMNPTWDSDISSDEAFAKAVALAEEIFNNVLTKAVSTVKSTALVDKAIDNSSDGIMILDRFLPWQEAIFSATNPKAEKINFIVFPSNRGGYNWQCVPTTLGGFDQRCPVPQEWRGATNLAEISGVKTATFCHSTGFIGSCETQEDAVKMCMIAQHLN